MVEMRLSRVETIVIGCNIEKGQYGWCGLCIQVIILFRST